PSPSQSTSTPPHLAPPNSASLPNVPSLASAAASPTHTTITSNAPFWHDLPARLRSAPHPTLLEAQAHLDRSPTGHHRFASALTLAEALLAAGDHQRAAYLFAGLAAEADRHHLDRWDPPPLVRCPQGTARVHHLTNNPQARDTTLQRLAPLAPMLEVEGLGTSGASTDSSTFDAR
ncbi:MAG TPA: hypothetical protein PKW35_01580, partial [Nannocystaceae bacterium]|nr:hypothetical protein [Nannocystaceae bacterium]